MKSFALFAKEFASSFFENRVTQAAAALCYYLTMTVFPLLIVIYNLLGQGHEQMEDILGFFKPALPENVFLTVSDFLEYISLNQSPAMLAAAGIVLLSYASAALRSLHHGIGIIQGGRAHRGFVWILISLQYSLVLLLAVYFGVFCLVSGRALLALHIDEGLIYLRFIVLFLLLFAFLFWLYHTAKRAVDDYAVMPGALSASFGVLCLSLGFTAFIESSARYSLVYGYITSLILLMLWLYMCCVLIYCGAILNVLLAKKASG